MTTIDDVIHIHTFTGITSPYSIELFINGTLVNFEIDTGSGVSIISEETYYKHFSRLKLMLSNSRIRTYYQRTGGRVRKNSNCC